MSALQDLFLPQARRTGQVVAEFDMGTTDPGKNQYPNGYCAGLTIHWLSLRSANKSWPADQKSTYGADIAKKAAATYTDYVKGQAATQQKAPLWSDVIPRGISTAAGAASLTGIDDTDLFQLKGALNAVLKNFGMAIDMNFEPMVWSGQRGRDFANEVAVRGDGYYYISMATKLDGKDASHAVGIHVMSRAHDSACHFFDPNVGHLAYANPDQLRWGFDRLLQSYSDAYKFNFYRGYALRLTATPAGLRVMP